MVGRVESPDQRLDRKRKEAQEKGNVVQADGTAEGQTLDNRGDDRDGEVRKRKATNETVIVLD